MPGSWYENNVIRASYHEIRLISLKRTSQKHIECNFEVHQLSSCPPFIALSYTWGHALPTRDISLEGVLFPIRENLWLALASILDHWDKYRKRILARNLLPPLSFLHFLRRRIDSGLQNVFDVFDGVASIRPKNRFYNRAPPLFWIDQISIDQGNIQERNEQVDMMRLIFLRASMALSWLGDADAASDSAMRHIRRAEQTRRWRKPASPNAETQDALLSLCQRRYWTRLWVVQEIALAQKVLILCGSQTLDFVGLSNYFEHLQLYRDKATGYVPQEFADSLFRSKASTLLKVSSAVSNDRDQFKSAPLCDLLNLCQNQECSDLRDKVFGILSLCPDHEISADYSKSTVEVHRDCVLAEARVISEVSELKTLSQALCDAMNLDTNNDSVTQALHLALFFHGIRQTIDERQRRPFEKVRLGKFLPFSPDNLQAFNTHLQYSLPQPYIPKSIDAIKLKEPSGFSNEQQNFIWMVYQEASAERALDDDALWKRLTLRRWSNPPVDMTVALAQAFFELDWSAGWGELRVKFDPELALIRAQEVYSDYIHRLKSK